MLVNTGGSRVGFLRSVVLWQAGNKGVEGAGREASAAWDDHWLLQLCSLS